MGDDLEMAGYELEASRPVVSGAAASFVSHERHDLQQLFRHAVRRDREAQKAKGDKGDRGDRGGGGVAKQSPPEELQLHLSDRNESGFKGVHRSATGKWLCQLSYNNTNYKVGVYDSRHHAARAYAVCAMIVQSFKARQHGGTRP
eukprot:scaffold112724_cov36-Phaeocystis_antarctica.AAC.1